MLKTNVIYCGHCVQVMQDYISDNSIDLTVTSPPYDQMTETYDLIPTLRDYNGYSLNFADLAGQLWRVTKPGGVVVWVVGDATIDGSETCTPEIQKLYFKGLGFKVHDTMIYNRQAQYPDKSRYSADFEFMYILSKGQPSTVNLIADKRNKYAGIKISGANRQKNGELKISWAKRNGVSRKEFGVRSNIWEITANSQPGHPAPFPEALARDHIISWSNPGDIVLDCMCGSGTTLKQAKELGRQWIGIDISQEYVDLAWRRVDGARVPHPEMLPKPAPAPEQLELI